MMIKTQFKYSLRTAVNYVLSEYEVKLSCKRDGSGYPAEALCVGFVAE